MLTSFRLGKSMLFGLIILFNLSLLASEVPPLHESPSSTSAAESNPEIHSITDPTSIPNESPSNSKHFGDFMNKGDSVLPRLKDDAEELEAIPEDILKVIENKESNIKNKTPIENNMPPILPPKPKLNDCNTPAKPEESKAIQPTSLPSPSSPPPITPTVATPPNPTSQVTSAPPLPSAKPEEVAPSTLTSPAPDQGDPSIPKTPSIGGPAPVSTTLPEVTTAPPAQPAEIAPTSPPATSSLPTTPSVESAPAPVTAPLAPPAQSASGSTIEEKIILPAKTREPHTLAPKKQLDSHPVLPHHPHKLEKFHKTPERQKKSLVPTQSDDKIKKTAVLTDDQLLFIKNESTMLILPDDDITLGHLTAEAKLKNMNYHEHLQLFLAQRERNRTINQAQQVNNFLQRYFKEDDSTDILFSKQELLTMAGSAITKDNLEDLRVLLANYPLINTQTKQGNSLLHKAVSANDFLISKWLVMKGIKLNITNNNNMTAHDIASSEQNGAIIDLLEQAGAE